MTPERLEAVRAILDRASSRGVCEQCFENGAAFDCECDGPEYEATGLCGKCLRDPYGPPHSGHRSHEIETVTPKLARELYEEILRLRGILARKGSPSE